MELDKSQQMSFNNITKLSNKINILIGAAGYGKTSTIKAILKEIWSSQKLNITPEDTHLCAPTGKAAKVIEESLRADHDFYAQLINKPSTIHRMLGCRGFEWEYNRDWRLQCKLVVVDEASMVDTELMSRLIYSTHTDTIFILVGDEAQLVPVGPGCPFKNLISLNHVGMVNRLAINHRAAEGGMIAEASDKIRAGRMPQFGTHGSHTLGGEREDDLFHIEIDDKEDILPEILKLCKKWQTKEIDYQILSPQRNGAVGINETNTYLQSHLNPPSPDKDELKIFNDYFRVGDKVMNTKNNYSLDIFNGYTGVILGVDPGNRSLLIDFDGQVVNVTNTINDITLAYCISIHKSQGSEYQRGALIIHSSHHFMLSRSLIYVGVTRFKDELYIIGDKKGLKRAVGNSKTSRRQTYLGDLITIWRRR